MKLKIILPYLLADKTEVVDSNVSYSEIAFTGNINDVLRRYGDYDIVNVQPVCGTFRIVVK